MAAIVTYAFDKRRWNDDGKSNVGSDDFDMMMDLYNTNNSLELTSEQLINEFFHDEDEDYIGKRLI